MAEIFEKCLKDISNSIQDLTRRKERLENRFKAILMKPADDFLSTDIERDVNAKDTQIRQQKLNLEIHKRAFELIREYKFYTERLAGIFDPFCSRYNLFTTESGISRKLRRTPESSN
jgi:hypothetical protein